MAGQPPGGDSQEASEAEMFATMEALISRTERKEALNILSQRRERFPDLGLYLWHARGVLATLLQEIISIYPALNAKEFSGGASNPVCNALALLQCIASHKDTRKPFVNARIPVFLIPFLNTTGEHKPVEYLRLTSLGVIGALVKYNDTYVLEFLHNAQIIDPCVAIMRRSRELSQTVATFIVGKLLAFKPCLNHTCRSRASFTAFNNVLAGMVVKLVPDPHAGSRSKQLRLLKHIFACYQALVESTDAAKALGQLLPRALADDTFAAFYADDEQTRVNRLNVLEKIKSAQAPIVRRPAMTAQQRILHLQQQQQQQGGAQQGPQQQQQHQMRQHAMMHPASHGMHPSQAYPHMSHPQHAQHIRR